MKTLFLGFIALVTSYFGTPKSNTIITEDIFAGRYDTSEVPIKYDINGVPINKDWLNSAEWRGKHINKFLLSKNEKKQVKKRFKAWKKRKMEEFVEVICKAAVEENKVYTKIPAELIAAQAILESNYGFSKVCKTANNFYGHKYRGSGDTAMYVIAHDDSPKDRFRKFKSTWWSIRAHSKLLTRMYGKRVNGKPTLKKWTTALCGGATLAKSKRHVENGGYTYATACYKNSRGEDECYGEKVLRIVRTLKLKKIIKQIKHGKQDTKAKRVCG
jgi:flagellum-specific peptidoglycan hydrolase FlgJ